jgi:hypothetical protein
VSVAAGKTPWHGFPEVELSFTDEQAVEKPKRCFQCDLELNLAQEWENYIED